MRDDRINPHKVHFILNKFKVHPYKPNLVHFQARDSESKLLFIA